MNHFQNNSAKTEEAGWWRQKVLFAMCTANANYPRKEKKTVKIETHFCDYSFYDTTLLWKSLLKLLLKNLSVVLYHGIYIFSCSIFLHYYSFWAVVSRYSPYVGQAGLKFSNSLPQSPKWQEYRCISTHISLSISNKQDFSFCKLPLRNSK